MIYDVCWGYNDFMEGELLVGLQWCYGKFE
jgi:hypothetical protein